MVSVDAFLLIADRIQVGMSFSNMELTMAFFIFGLLKVIRAIPDSG